MTPRADLFPLFVSFDLPGQPAGLGLGKLEGLGLGASPRNGHPGRAFIGETQDVMTCAVVADEFQRNGLVINREKRLAAPAFGRGKQTG